MRTYPEMTASLEERFSTHPVRRFLDFRILELGPDRCTMSIEFKPEFDNTSGAVHGGILAMLADTAVACALSTAFDGEMNFATSNLNIHFLRRANAAVTASATIICQLCGAFGVRGDFPGAAVLHAHDQPEIIRRDRGAAG